MEKVFKVGDRVVIIKPDSSAGFDVGVMGVVLPDNERSHPSAVRVETISHQGQYWRDWMWQSVKCLAHLDSSSIEDLL